MSNTQDQGAGAVGPSDKEVVAMLQRLASAQAMLLQAESASELARPGGGRAGARNDEIEEAHTNLLWAQAQLITAAKEQRAQKAVETARQREKQILKRYGYATFREYLAERTSVPTTDIHLEVARTEYEAAQSNWDQLSSQMTTMVVEASGATVVIDLTGDNPRRIA